MQAWPILLILLLATGLAGCSDNGSKAGTDDPFDEPIDTKSGTGAIRGIVVDPSVRPVEGATTELVGHDRSTKTDAAGRFTFVDLAPGSYFLKASRPGWTEVQQNVEVVADKEPPITKILLEEVPGTAPGAETLKVDGFVACTAGTPLNAPDCDATDSDRNPVFLAFDGAPDWIQTEIEWESTQPAGEEFYLMQAVCTCNGSLPGPDDRFNETNGATSGYMARAGPDYLRAQGAGTTAREVAVYVSPGGPANGSGLVLNQEFTVYITFFYNMEPLADWRFVEDGDHPVPS